MPASPAAWPRSTVQRPDGRHVGPQFLARLGAFDQDAALLAGEPAMRAQIADPVEQAVGALDAFQRDDAAADRDRRLADIERADRRAARQRRPRSRRSAASGRRLVIGAVVGEQVRQDLMRADDAYAVGFEQPATIAQKAVVAAGERGDDARQKPQAAGAPAERRQWRPTRHPAAITTWVTRCRLSSGKSSLKSSIGSSSCSRRRSARQVGRFALRMATQGAVTGASSLSATSTGSRPLPAIKATLSPLSDG